MNKWREKQNDKQLVSSLAQNFKIGASLVDLYSFFFFKEDIKTNNRTECSHEGGYQVSFQYLDMRTVA